jgi:dihydroorotate dehydrogenase (fumarate)
MIAMRDLSTHWLGLRLESPFVIGASPLSDDLEKLAELVEAGAGAVVLPSLFEEQIQAEQMAAFRYIDSHVDMDAEARSFLPESQVFSLGPEPYLARIRKTKAAVSVPVIASLNGVSPGGWTNLARRIAEAGADALELNLYDVVTSFEERSAEVEDRQLRVVEQVVAGVAPLPVCVKLSPFYTSLPSFAQRLHKLGVQGLTLFNRFYQPDIDIEALDLDRHLVLSTPAELPLRLHALALLRGRVPLSLAVSGGVHRGCDAVRAILSGASAVQMVSALLQGGPPCLREAHKDLRDWLSGKGYVSVREACGVMRLDNVPNPQAWERLNYARVLRGWESEGM